MNLFCRKEKKSSPASASTSVQQTQSKLLSKSSNMKSSIKKSISKPEQKNAPDMPLVTEEFDDGEDEALNEIKTLYYCIEEEPRDRTFTDAVKETFLRDVTVSSALKQFVIGGMIGWATWRAPVTSWLGKTAGMAVGGILLLFQVAEYNGLIKVDCMKVQHVYTKDDARVKCFEMKNRQSVFGKVRTFCEENFFLATGFATGYCSYI